MPANDALGRDIAEAKRLLATLPTHWDGKKSVLEMKEAAYNWRQMEWWAFYFELLFRRANVARQHFAIPGERINSVRFDLTGCMNWDMKAKAIKSDSHVAILNDIAAVDATIAKFGHYGAIVALCDVEYNDASRTFQRWREALQGGKSAYQKERETRTEVSRYRKTKAVLREVLFLCVDAKSVKKLGMMKQGRNSNAKPRPPKYMVDLEACAGLICDKMKIGG